jgi:hypothetical protein
LYIVPGSRHIIRVKNYESVLSCHFAVSNAQFCARVFVRLQ